MSKMIQLRHVPEDLHRKLKARAALSGLSLSDTFFKRFGGSPGSHGRRVETGWLTDRE
jgi:hypothetical protein